MHTLIDRAVCNSEKGLPIFLMVSMVRCEGHPDLVVLINAECIVSIDHITYT